MSERGDDLETMDEPRDLAPEVAAEVEQNGTETQQRPPEMHSAARPAARSILWDLLAVIAAVAIILGFYQPVRVEGTSMLPMLEDQDRLVINKFAYHVGEIHRGDVVVFLYPHDHTKRYIKRVIALPGDHLRIDHGTVWVNGQALKEPYVPVQFEDDRSQPEMTIPQDEYFMMGDHRTISSDSRDFGPVPRNLIYGRAAFVYWPADQAGVVR